MTAPISPWVAAHERWRRPALWIGVGALVGCALAGYHEQGRILSGYLVAWLFFLSLSLGSLAVLMMYHLTGGAWGSPVRRYFEAAAVQVPLLALLSAPLAWGSAELFPWWNPPTALAADIADKQWYLNPPFFFARAACYLTLWTFLAVLLERATRRQHRVPGLSAGGLLVYSISVTFAAADWISSLVPRWSSTALGLIVIVGQGLGAFAFAVTCTTAMHQALRRQSFPFRPELEAAPVALSAQQTNDLGNLLLAFIMMWMYLEFSQFLIIWAEDMPRETVWYLPRSQGFWRSAGIALMLAQFAIPFTLLLFRRLKRDPRTLGVIALLALCAHWLDVGWLVLPSLRPDPLRTWDIVATLGVGGIWLYGVGRNLSNRPSFAHAGFAASRSSRSGALGHG